MLVDETLGHLSKCLFSSRALSEKNPPFSSTSNRTNEDPLKKRLISWIIKENLRRTDVDNFRLIVQSLRHAAVNLSIKNETSVIQAQAQW